MAKYETISAGFTMIELLVIVSFIVMFWIFNKLLPPVHEGKKLENASKKISTILTWCASSQHRDSSMCTEDPA
jgi:Tfp pilus assembly protein FimT